MSVPVQPQPSHPHLFEVRSTPGSSETEFNTSAHSLVSLPPGALFVKLTSPPLTLTTTKAYSSIQLSRTEHAELHSDLLYVNHSCEPSLVFDMAKREVRVAARRAVGVASGPGVASQPGRVASQPGSVEGQEEREEGKEQEEKEEKEQQQEQDQEKERGLQPGDELTFFYPSSEWSMAQPFECRCSAPEGVCKGWIGGAKEMGRERMKGMWLNAFIEELLDEQEREAAAARDGEATAAAAATTAKDGEETTTAVTVKDGEATAGTAAVKDVEATANEGEAPAKDGDEQPTVKERSKRTGRKASCNVQ